MKGRSSSTSPLTGLQVLSSSSKEVSQGLELRFSIRDAWVALSLVGRARVILAKARRIRGESCMFEVGVGQSDVGWY